MEGEGLTTNQKGAIAEAKIAAEAIRLGIEVYRPAIEGGRYDLILDVGRKLLRIQCKWATRRGDIVDVRLQTCRRGPDGMIYRSYTRDEIDAVVAYCAVVDECYFLPAPLVVDRRQLYLRLAPAKNNQMLKLHFAEQYRLGAIAQLGERLAGSQKVAGSSPASSTDTAHSSPPA